MMMDDEALRRRFHALRDVDRARAPAFDAVVQAPPVRTAPRRARVGWALAAAAAAATIALYAGLAARRAATAERWAAGAAIARWQAPTDALLRAGGRELLAAPPALGASVLDTIVPPPRLTPRSD
jgi:hypothetical protein